MTEIAIQAPLSIMPLADQITHICALRAQGLTYREIAAKTDLSYSTVGNRLRDEDAKAILEQATKHHIRSLPIAIARHQELIASDDEPVALNAIKVQYQITGIMPSHTASITIQNLYLDQRNRVLSAGITALLGTPRPDPSPDSPDDSIIDVEEE